MKKLDIYILKKFLGTFVFIIILLSAISIVIDLSEKIDDIIENEVPMNFIIFDYYVNFVPYIVALLGPFFIFIAVIFFTSQMAGRTEIVAILSSRVSFNRMLFPYFVGATILAFGLLVANHWLVPQANSKRLAFEHEHIRKRFVRYNRNIHRQIEKNVFMYIETFNGRDTTGKYFTLETIENGELKVKLKADKVKWMSKSKQWRVFNYEIRDFGAAGEELSKGATLDTLLNIHPKDFMKRTSAKEEMTTAELSDYIEKLIASGADNYEFFLIEKHRRTSSAFSIYVLTLIGVSVASRKVRGGMGLHIVFGIVLSAAYEVIMKFSTTFSTNADLPPFLGVWIPNIIFTLLAVYLWKSAPK